MTFESSLMLRAPLVKPSKLTAVEKGGGGKNLSDGFNCNFAVGCTHACPFCYVDGIQKRFGASKYGPTVNERWGEYLLAPANLEQAILDTPWKRWAGEEVMLSSMHDPYLPQLMITDPFLGQRGMMARLILQAALPQGVRFCIQTRSLLVLRDLDLLVRYKSQVRLQVSLATSSRELARVIEPRVPTAERRVSVLRIAKEAGLTTGVILAPIFPPNKLRPNLEDDLKTLAAGLARVRPDFIYGESLHERGQNMDLVNEAVGEKVTVPFGFDMTAKWEFLGALREQGLEGTWWAE